MATPANGKQGMVVHLLITLNVLTVIGFYVIYFRIDEISNALTRLSQIVEALSSSAGER